MRTLQNKLNQLEAWGNRLPHPTALFLLLGLITVLLSWISAHFSLSAVHPLTGNTIFSTNLLSLMGLQRILSSAVSNFTDFAPVGPVIVVMLGLGIAEKSGLLNHLLSAAVKKTPNHFLSFSIVLTGILSNLAADAGYVVLIPLAGLLFQAAGRHPLAGVAAAFAGVSGGYSANLVVGPVDIILSGISTEAVQLIKPTASVLMPLNIMSTGPTTRLAL